MNVSVDAMAITVAIGRCVPSKVTPTISAAVDASMNWQNRRSDAALPEISGKGVSPPAVACGMVQSIVRSDVDGVSEVHAASGRTVMLQ